MLGLFRNPPVAAISLMPLHLSVGEGASLKAFGEGGPQFLQESHLLLPSPQFSQEPEAAGLGLGWGGSQKEGEGEDSFSSRNAGPRDAEGRGPAGPHPLATQRKWLSP